MRVQDGNALEFASETLRNDRELVLLAIEKSKGCAFLYAREELQNDKIIFLAALKLDGLFLQCSRSRAFP